MRRPDSGTENPHRISGGSEMRPRVGCANHRARLDWRFNLGIVGWFVITRIFILGAAHLGALTMSEPARKDWDGAVRACLARPLEGRLGPVPHPLL